VRFGVLILCRIDWDIHKFKQISRGYWDDIANQKKFMDGLAKKLTITESDGWYTVMGKTIQDHGGDGLLQRHSWSPYQLLKSVLPRVSTVYLYA